MLQKIHKDLGITSSYSYDTGIPVYEEPDELVAIGPDIFGRPQKLVPKAAEKWKSMELAASKDHVSLLVVSAYRSVSYQASLIRTKLERGQSIDEILKINAAPGHSEHHSGKALDFTTLDCKPLCEKFDGTGAFHWLTENAQKYGFTMSYPKENKWGISYEPWHWCYSRA